MTEDTSPENLRKFLESDDPALVMMGLSMAKGGGVPDELLPTILKFYMWSDDKTIRAAAKSVFVKQAPDELKDFVKENWKPSYRTLSISGDKYPEIVKPFLGAFKTYDFALLEPLIKALEDIDWTVRYRAIVTLGGISPHYYTKTPHVVDYLVEPLIKVLEDEDEYGYVRSNAASVLGEIGDKRAVEPLIKALGDNVYVRYEALPLSGFYTGDRGKISRGAVLKMKKKKPVAVIVALGKIGDKRAVEPLIELLKDPTIGNRHERLEKAVEALGRIGDKRAVEPIIKALHDNIPLNDASAGAKWARNKILPRKQRPVVDWTYV